MELGQLARNADVNLTIDAEESERLALHIGLFERLMREPSLADWPGLGLAIQTYQTRAPATIDHLLALSDELSRPITVRFTKGAYWDAEIKRAQELGLTGFPVYTRKWATDLSYLATARRLLAHRAPVYPQFATHNALTVASIIEFAAQLAPGRRYEFQRLHGMGDPLYDALLADGPDARVRVYAPVGEFRDLLAYLVRRLLENGSNTSFVHQITDRSVPATSLVEDAYEQAQRLLAAADEPASVLPTGSRLFPGRSNSSGIDLQHAPTLAQLTEAVARVGRIDAAANSTGGARAARTVTNPARRADIAGTVADADADIAREAVGTAYAAMRAWDARGVEERAVLIERVADAWESAHDELVALIVREGGRTMLDAHMEVREAIDFCRYYAVVARDLMRPQALPGPAGESNELRLAGRGVFVCISPWNFPLAIFGGQIVAALVTGNSVVAKPAEQTPLVAYRAVQLMYEAGIPRDVLQFVLGRRRNGGTRADRRSPRGGRRLHRFDRHRAGDQPRPGSARRPDRRADC